MTQGQRSNQNVKWFLTIAAAFAVVGAVLEYRSGGDKIPWRTYDKALQEAALAGMPVYVDLYATWCGPCKAMDRQTFANDTVRQLLTSGYIPARIDIDSKDFNDSLKKAWHIRGVPTSIVVSPYGLEVGRRVGFLSSGNLQRWLKDPALMAFSAWLGLEDSRAKAKKEGKRLLIVVTKGSESAEDVQDFFADSTMRSFVYDGFVPALLNTERPDHAFWLDSLAGRPTVASVPQHGMLLLVTTSEPRILGQIFLTEEEFEDQAKVRERLQGYIASRK